MLQKTVGLDYLHDRLEPLEACNYKHLTMVQNLTNRNYMQPLPQGEETDLKGQTEYYERITQTSSNSERQGINCWFTLYCNWLHGFTWTDHCDQVSQTSPSSEIC